MEERENWWRDRLNRFLSASVKLIVEALGESNVRSIFLIGSFASEEGSVVLETANPVVLSDFDLAVVLTSFEAFKRLYPLRRELGSRCEKLLDDLSFLSHVDVGMYLLESLRTSPARPGVYDFKQQGRILFGDPGDRAFLPDYQPSEIGGGEAVALIENRIVPHLEAHPEPPPRTELEHYRFLYQVSRAYTDLLTAALAMKGHYRAGYGARCALLQDTGTANEIKDLVGEGSFSRFEAWTRFKIAPSIESLHLDLNDSGAKALWEEAASDLITFWKRAEMSRQGLRYDVPASQPAETLLQGRKGGTGGINSLRSWRAYMSGFSPGRKIALGFAMGGRLLRRDPIDIIRAHGVLLLERYVCGMRDSEVLAPRGGFPHSGGDWVEASSAVVSQWERVVFG